MPESAQLRQLFEACVEQNADAMFRVAFRLTGQRDFADELVQESYMQAWKNIHSLKNEAAMRGWLFAILRNQYTKLLRRRRPSEPLTETHLVATDDSDTEKQDVKDCVQSALKHLDDDHKFPVLLVSMEGLTVKAAAEILNIPKGTVLSRLHPARQKLKTILQHNFDSPTNP